MHAARTGSLTLLAGSLAALTLAVPAAAQPVDVRVRVDTQAIRDAAEEVRRAVADVLGPDVRREIQDGLTLVGRDVAAVIEDIARAPWAATADSWMRTTRQRNFPATQTDRQTLTFAIGATGVFDIENLSGDIRIQPGGGRELSLGITRTSRGRTEADARAGLSRVRVETTHRGERATARTIYPNERQSNYSVTVDYVITAPAGTRITAETISGDLIVGAMTGDLTVKTTSGDVRVTGATRLLSATSVSGDVTLSNIKSDSTLDVGTMSGDVLVTGLTAQRISLSSLAGDVTARDVRTGDAKLSSLTGDVRFDGVLEDRGRYDFSSQSGDIRLALDGRPGFSFEARTFSGSVSSELTLQTTGTTAGGRRPARELRGTVGNGSATVSARSFSGSVVVVRR